MAVGPDLVYVHVQCCHGVGCNNGSFVEVPRGKPNGKLCYSCRETGADWYHPVTLLRGCTSTDLCRSWELLGRLLLLANTLKQLHLPTASGLRCPKCLRWQGNCRGEVETCAPGQNVCVIHELDLNREVPRGKPNGKLCYSCRETGEGECNHQQLQTITCMGAMDMCVKAQSTDQNNPGTLLRGCGSPDLCRPWQPLARLLLPSDPQIHCCNESAARTRTWWKQQRDRMCQQCKWVINIIRWIWNIIKSIIGRGRSKPNERTPLVPDKEE
ncbi:hypothetical protein Y1Q_0008554 [Alligator mississippiensis]|uniref:Uncharacterized protein n=1 Tax=Alligator mississippiensis TaxID=8496 RepID=A0A151ND41_ALLMI|nr:hypothetical protein Y1Q_0008554 [Alligator mississippiensis]